MTDSEKSLPNEDKWTKDFEKENDGIMLESEGLPPIAYFTLNPVYKQGIIWERGNSDLKEGDELVRRSDVKNLIQDKIEQAEEKVDKYSGFDRLSLNDAKARKQELKQLLEELEQ